MLQLYHEKMIGAYKIQQMLGSGRLSTLYLAIHPVLDSTVALTTFVVAAQLSAQAHSRFLSRFTQGVSALATLQHPHILSIDDYGEQDGNPYIVVVAVVAESLFSLLRHKRRWSPESALPIVKQVSSALEYAHGRGVVHGGLKPAHILVYEDQGVQVTGFGLDRLLLQQGIDEVEEAWANTLSVVGTFLGSLEYLAPECVQGKPADARSDIYAFGCILFEMLTGAPPFAGTPLEMMAQQINAPVPSLRASNPDHTDDLLDQLDVVLQKALAPESSQRFQQVKDFVSAYEQCLASYSRSDRDKALLYKLESRSLEEEVVVEADVEPQNVPTLARESTSLVALHLPHHIYEDDLETNEASLVEQEEI